MSRPVQLDTHKKSKAVSRDRAVRDESVDIEATILKKRYSTYWCIAVLVVEGRDVRLSTGTTFYKQRMPIR